MVSSAYESQRQWDMYLILPHSADVSPARDCADCHPLFYQTVEDRKVTLENVMAIAKGQMTVIAHVACNNTKDSAELARHAEHLGVDAIASIPPDVYKRQRLYIPFL